MNFRKTIGFTVLGLALLAGGYGISSLIKKADVDSTTTIMPDINSTPPLTTVTMNGDGVKPDDFYLYFQTNTAGVTPNFSGYDPNIVSFSSRQIQGTSWWFYDFTSKDATQQHIIVKVTPDAGVTFFPHLWAFPNSETSDIYMGIYYSAGGAYATTIMGDAGAFAPDQFPLKKKNHKIISHFR